MWGGHFGSSESSSTKSRARGDEGIAYAEMGHQRKFTKTGSASRQPRAKTVFVCLCDRDDHYSNPSCDGLVTSGNASGQHRVWKNINLTSLDSIGHVLCLQSAWPPSSYWTWKSARWECNFQEGLRLLAIKHAQCRKKISGQTLMMFMDHGLGGSWRIYFLFCFSIRSPCPKLFIVGSLSDF